MTGFVRRNGTLGLPERQDRALVFRGPLYGRHQLPTDTLEEIGACNHGEWADAGVCPGREIDGHHITEAYFRPVSTGLHFFYITGYSFLGAQTSLVIAPDTNRSAGVVVDMSVPDNEWGSSFQWFTKAGRHQHGIHMTAGELYYLRTAEYMHYSRGFLNLAVRAPPRPSDVCEPRSLYVAAPCGTPACCANAVGVQTERRCGMCTWVDAGIVRCRRSATRSCEARATCSSSQCLVTCSLLARWHHRYAAPLARGAWLAVSHATRVVWLGRESGATDGQRHRSVVRHGWGVRLLEHHPASRRRAARRGERQHLAGW